MVAGGTLLFILGYVTLFDRIRYDLLDDEGNEVKLMKKENVYTPAVDSAMRVKQIE